MKQEVLADALGVSQQTVSRMEASEKVEDELLEKVANILGVPAEVIRNFDEEKAVNIISNTFHDGFHDQSAFINSNCIQNINPVDKWLEVLEENKKLYERLLQSEKEKVSYLEKLLKFKE